MNTIIAAAAGGITSVALKHRIAGTYEARTRYDVGALCNGILIGLVAITGPCNNVEPWAAAIIGVLAGLLLGLSTRLLIKIKVDDPLEATQVHGFGGLLGLFLTGFFDRDEGVFYGGDGKQLGIQVAGMVAITAWSIVMSGIYFFTLKKLGKFRVPLIYEIVGLDYFEHGGPVVKTSD